MADSDDATKLEHELVRANADAKAAGEVAGVAARSLLSTAIAAAVGAAAVPTFGPAGLLAVPATAALLDGLLAAGERIGAGRKALEAAQDAESLRALHERTAELVDRIRALEERGTPPRAGDVAGVIATYLDAARSAVDDRKRRVLTNAVVNAFDPELHDLAITRGLFGILERLDYAEIHLLARIAEAQQGTKWIAPWLPYGSISAVHADRLSAERLIQRKPTAESQPGPGYVKTTDDVAYTSELGDRLLALAADPPAPSPAKPSE